MNQVKEQTRYLNKNLTKFPRKFDPNQRLMPISSIENLSNEFFYEIFDYLDGCDIHQAFSDLNYRFHQLLHSSSYPFKIKFHSDSNDIFMKQYKRFILLNRRQILSINLELPFHVNQLLLSFTINSSFDHLESLTFVKLDPDILLSILSTLIPLPRLSSLTVQMDNILTDLTDIYQIIFTLPKLKYYKFTIGGSDLPISLPLATNQQLSPIEYLIIDHCCAFEEFSTIISYTPQVRHLNFTQTDDDIGIISPINLANLTHLSIHGFHGNFDEFKMLISQPYLKLKMLTFTTRSENIDYLDSNRWEKLILKYLPKLEEFYFEYYECIDYEMGSLIYFCEPNQFSSTFWIERKWIFEGFIDQENIIYSVRPERKRWYESAQHPIIHSSFQISNSARLTYLHDPPNKCHALLIRNIEYILNLSQIYHVEIRKEKMFIGTLVSILFALPKLVSLKIHSLSLSEPRYLCCDESNDHNLISDMNTIEEVCLEKFNNIDEVYALIGLCPRMNYLQIDDINNMDVNLFVRNILKKITDEFDHDLCSLCFCVPTADDKMIRKLERMINIKRLLFHFTIKRVMDKIYLEWE